MQQIDGKRRAVFLAGPAAFILVLPLILGDTGIWLAMPLTEAVTFVVSWLYLRRSGVKLKFDEMPGYTTIEG